MNSSSNFHVVNLPFCQAVMFEAWNAPPGRFFAAYRARHGFTSLLGHGVVDEFRTISAPILLCPETIIGGIYDTGMRLADERDVEAPIDQGWPPLTIGIDIEAPDRAGKWRDEMLTAMKNASGTGDVPWGYTVRESTGGGYSVSALHCMIGSSDVATVLATNAPLLPEQLGRLADIDNAPVTVAVSVGNRLPRIEPGEFHEVDVVSEKQLADLLVAVASRNNRQD